MCAERKTGCDKTWAWFSIFSYIMLLVRRRNMRTWQAVVGTHELVAAFKTVKVETLPEELKVLPAGAVYIQSPSAQPLHLASSLPTWFICFGQAGPLRPVSRHKVPVAKQVDSSSEYTVRTLSGFNTMKGSVHLTEIKLFVLSFAHQFLAISQIFSGPHCKTVDVKMTWITLKHKWHVLIVSPSNVVCVSRNHINNWFSLLKTRRGKVKHSELLLQCDFYSICTCSGLILRFTIRFNYQTKAEPSLLYSNNQKGHLIKQKSNKTNLFHNTNIECNIKHFCDFKEKMWLSSVTV